MTESELVCEMQPVALSIKQKEKMTVREKNLSIVME